MFFRLYFYKLKALIFTKEELFWMLLFPVALATLFYLTIGSISEKQENFNPVPVAIVVTDDESSKDFVEVCKELSKDNEDQLLDSQFVNDDKALKLLRDKKVDGIIYAGDDITLTVNDEALNQSILKTFIDQYKVEYSAISNIATKNPQNVNLALKVLEDTKDYNEEISLSDGETDYSLLYFYNLLAMTCLYGCFAGINCAIALQANITALGARRCVAPTNKFVIILADFLATFTVQYICVAICIAYIQFVLGVNLGVGGNMPYVILLTAISSLLGVANGLFVGSIGQLGEGIKYAIIVGGTMTCCFLSGLMFGDMPYIIEEKCPIINRINPAKLISDSFYSLNIFDNYDRFYTNIITLSIITAVLCIGSFILVRRKKYASL